MSKPRKLRVRWSKRDRDLIFDYPTQKVDGHLAYWAFCCQHKYPDPSFVDELKKRGYDITTLKFEIVLAEPVDAEVKP